MLSGANRLLAFKDILKGSLTTFLISVSTIISGYLFIYFINKMYGTAFVGTFTTIQSLFFIISILCTLGFDTLSLKLFSSHNNVSYLFSIYKTMIRSVMIISTLLAFLIYLNSDFIMITNGMSHFYFKSCNSTKSYTFIKDFPL